MNKIHLPLLVTVMLIAQLLNAQTWNGSSSTDWNTAANWTPASVPTATSTVTIPNTSNKPVLGNDVIIMDVTMSIGSGLDFNGFALTVNGNFDMNGALLSNSNGSTDITITITGAGVEYFRQNTVNDNIVINCNGTSAFYEAYQFPNTYNGTSTFNIGGPGIFYTCYDNSSSFNGDVTVMRTVAGPTYIFSVGAITVGGNFSYINNSGGNTNIHTSGVISMPVSGTINIDVNTALNPDFLMKGIKNLTSGGIISVQNAGLIAIEKDSLLLNAFNINGFNGTGLDDFSQNAITGTINISDAPENTGSIYFRGNLITGNTIFSLNGNAAFYEGYQYADIFNGNATFNIAGPGIFYTCYDKVSTFNGDVSFNRTVAGSTYVFDAGAIAIAGDFSYINNSGGSSNIHASGVETIPIGGTVNINITGAGNPDFLMKRIKNSTTGGVVSVQNSGLITIALDTLLLTSFNINAFSGPGTDDFLQNSIIGNVSISDALTNSGFIYFRGNNITGNTDLLLNSASQLYESYQYGNTYNGSLALTRLAGTIFFTYDHPSTITENLTLNSAGGVTFSDTVKFAGGLNGIVEQAGSQAFEIPKLLIDKIGGSTLTLNDSVTITDKLTFNNGNIISSSINQLKFSDGTTHSGASAVSHVIGTVSKSGDDAFSFPVGSNTSLNAVAMTPPTTGSVFSTQYNAVNPDAVGDTSIRAATLQRISGCEYWDIQRVSGTSNVTLTFDFGPPCAGPGSIYITNPSTVHIAHWNGAIWEDLGNGGSTGTTTGTIATAGAVNNFSPFTFGSTDTIVNPLPLKLIYFNAHKVQDKVQLSWQTENEFTASRFEIEKSVTGSGFSRLNSTPANNITGQNNYLALDNMPAKGMNYYRLKSIDLDGRFTYSDIVKVDFSKFFNVTIAPNPARDMLIIKDGTDFREVKIIDAAGRILLSANITGVNQQVNIHALAGGKYALRLSGDRGIYTLPFIKQ